MFSPQHVFIKHYSNKPSLIWNTRRFHRGEKYPFFFPVMAGVDKFF